MKKELQIPIAYDQETGELFDVAKELHNNDLIYQAQKLYNTDYWDAEEYFIKEQLFPNFNIKALCCYECEQVLELAVSSNNRPFLRHKIGSLECDFKNSTPKENKLITQTYQSKESKEHYNLKHKFGQALQLTKDVSNVIVDSKFLFSEWGKRKPDVLCEFKDVVFVFEFQITEISLRYIISRSKFYKKSTYNNKPIFLIWMLNEKNIIEVKDEVDNKIKLKQSSLAKRIKYLGKHQNFFSYNDKDHAYVKLSCHFKCAFINKSALEIHSKWTERVIELPSLKLDYVNRETHFYHFETQKEDLIPDLELLIEYQRLEKIKAHEAYLDQLKIEKEKLRQEEIRQKQFKQMRVVLLKAKNILNNLSSSVKLQMDKVAKQEDYVSMLGKIEIDEVLRIRESQPSISAYSLGVPIDVYKIITPLLEEFNLYELQKKIIDFKRRPQYLKAKQSVAIIKQLKTIDDKDLIYYEINNVEFKDLFCNEKTSRNICCYEKKDREYLFGITIKPKSYYDMGDNVALIYLYNFNQELMNANDEITTIERIIEMATENLAGQQKRLKSALIKLLEEYTFTQSNLVTLYEERNQFLQSLYWKYYELFENNIPQYFCTHYYISNEICMYDGQYEKCICHDTNNTQICSWFAIEKSV